MKRITIILMLAAVVLAGCKDKEKKTEERVISVNVKVIEEETFGEKRNYVGTIEASEAITLSFEAGGNVKDVFVKVGDNVHAGQLLARLDKTSAQSSYDAAKSTLEQAEDGYRRAKLSPKCVGSKFRPNSHRLSRWKIFRVRHLSIATSIRLHRVLSVAR